MNQFKLLLCIAALGFTGFQYASECAELNVNAECAYGAFECGNGDRGIVFSITQDNPNESITIYCGEFLTGPGVGKIYYVAEKTVNNEVSSVQVTQEHIDILNRYRQETREKAIAQYEGLEA